MSGLRERLVSLPTAAVLALTVGAAALVGVVGGGTLARWRDVETASASMSTGVVVFGAGTPGTAGTLGDYATGPGDTVQFTFGTAAAQTLYDEGSVRIPVQVDALAQGHRGLRYTVTRQILPGGVFADSTVRLVKVASKAACDAGQLGPDLTAASTIVAADYSASKALTSEYLCLVATFERMKGTYDNTASLTVDVPGLGGDPSGKLTATGSWSAQVRKTFVPANEGTHSLTFSFTTFRPGQ